MQDEIDTEAGGGPYLTVRLGDVVVTLYQFGEDVVVEIDQDTVTDDNKGLRVRVNDGEVVN